MMPAAQMSAIQRLLNIVLKRIGNMHVIVRKPL
jgi:hypothetical protein